MLKFFNPYVALAFILALAGAGAYGIHIGQGLEQAKYAKAMSLQEALQTTIATEVSKIKVSNTTIKQTIEGKTRESIIYRECRAGDDVVGLLNSALTGKAAAPAARDLVVPATNTPD